MRELVNFGKKYWFAFVLCITSLSIIKYFFDTVCYSVILFGLPCPACGITRATKLLLSGNFIESFRMHPLLILVILGAILYLILNILLNKYVEFIKYYGIICILLFICLYIYRMYTYYPSLEPMIYREDNLLNKALTLIQYMRQG